VLSVSALAAGHKTKTPYDDDKIVLRVPYEYADFDGHLLWKEKDSEYRTEKTDPGVGFMDRLRIRVSDLKLSGSPAAR